MSEHRHDWQETGLPTASGGQRLHCATCGAQTGRLEPPSGHRLGELLEIEREWFAIGEALGPFWRNQESMTASRAAELLIWSYGYVRETLRQIHEAVEFSDPIHREYVLVQQLEQLAARALKETPGLLPEPWAACGGDHSPMSCEEFGCPLPPLPSPSSVGDAE